MTDPAEQERLARKARRRQDRRRRILDAARRVLAEAGAEAFTVTNVAAAADVSTPSLYYYFKDKEALADALARDLFESEVTALMQAVEAAPTGEDALVALVRARVAWARDNPEAWRLLYEGISLVGTSPALLREVVYPASARLAGRVEERLRHDQQAGLVHPEVEPRALANVAWCTAQGILSIAAGMARLGGDMRHSVDQLAQEACRHLRRGCRPPPADSPAQRRQGG